MKNEVLIVKGGNPLFGSVVLPSNKNSVLPILCATLIRSGTTVLSHVPKSPDVLKIIQALEKLGAVCTWQESKLFINTIRVSSYEVDPCVSDIQAGILFAGPLLNRFGCAVIPRGKGCKLGHRGPEKHIEFFSKAGISCEQKGDVLVFKELTPKRSVPITQSGSLKSNIEHRTVSFQKPAVTPTENILMYLAGRPEEEWSLHGLAQEPHVCDLIGFLNLCSTAKVIHGDGSSRKIIGTIDWKDDDIHFQTGLDHVDAAGWMSLSAVTRGEIILKDVFDIRDSTNIIHLANLLQPLGLSYQKNNQDMVICGEKYNFSPDNTVERYSDTSWKIVPGPWPQEPVDTLPSFAVLATTNYLQGTETHIINHMFEDGLRYGRCFHDIGIPVIEQNMMLTIKGHRQKVVISEVTAPDVIEGSRAVIWTALGLPKGSIITIRNWQPILRRNPDIIEILKKLGADIEIVQQ